MAIFVSIKFRPTVTPVPGCAAIRKSSRGCRSFYVEDDMWEKLPAYEGQIHQGCLNCAPVERIAPMDMLIAVGFGVAEVTKDREIVYQEDPSFDEDFHKIPSLSKFEAMAVKNPNHDWRVLINAPLRSSEYQRHGKEKWVLIASGQGFA